MRIPRAMTLPLALAVVSLVYACADDAQPIEASDPLDDDGGTTTPRRDASTTNEPDEPVDGGPETAGGDAGEAGDAAVDPPQKVMVVRVGQLDGGTLGELAAQLFIDEYEMTSNTLERTIPLPTAANGDHRAIVQTSAAVPVHEGAISRSSDKHAAIVTGYTSYHQSVAMPPFVIMGPPDLSLSPRVVARVDADGGIDTTTLLSDSFAATEIGGAAMSDDNVWLAGTNGGPVGPVQHLKFRNSVGGGATNGNDILTPPGGMYYALRIFDGELYASSRDGAIVDVGSGLPIMGGETATPLVEEVPGAFEFELVDMDGAQGAERLYVALDGEGAEAGAPGGVRRYSYGAASKQWELTATFSDGFDGGARGLTAYRDGTNVVIVATTADGKRLVRLVDTGGTTATPSTIATAPAGVVYRGVTVSPLP